MRTIILTLVAASMTACSILETEEASRPASTVEPVALQAEPELILPEMSMEVVDSEPEILFTELESKVEPPPPPKVHFSLRRGETLAHFARWSEIPVEDIADTSELDLDGDYPVGTQISLVLTPDERAYVEERRVTHHRTRAENYLASRGATGTDAYRVRTGDSAWTIARDTHGMPVWLLESLNPSVDLDKLRPGLKLQVPVFSDIVVEAPQLEDTDVPE